jgi:class 3 adenylate cyclase
VQRIGTWARIATDWIVVRQALATALVVGAILTLVNHGDVLATGLAVDHVWQIGLTFLVPYLVSTTSSILTIERQRSGSAASYLLLERQIEEINRFPDQNPNPVLRTSWDGRLLYANPASAPILASLGLAVDEQVPAHLLEALTAGASDSPPRPIEVESGVQTFSLLAVPVPELKVLNVYGTDITGTKVVEKYPNQNPNPVLRTSATGTLVYANPASSTITRSLGIEVGQQVPDELAEQIRARIEGVETEPIEVRGDGRTYALTAVDFPELGFRNLYGTDVTALHAINKFPDQNPNPVLRVARDGRLSYANPASALVREAFRTQVGEVLAPDLFQRLQAIAIGRAPNMMEVEAGGRLFALLVVSVFEFESINIYGTDITAAREVERANAENERLLLNILPASIAARLRHGEGLIADRFEEVAVLFADVVGFTPLAAELTPTQAVHVLNEIFSIFDNLAEAHGLEKIKTSGDSYMVVGGLTPESAGQVERVALMGLEMIDELARYRTPEGRELQIRVGLHIGPAVGGVIGLKKFIYDVWGDTVNTASRMESHGEAGKIQVSEATYQRLKGICLFEPRGTIEVKGKGPMSTFFLVGRTPAKHASSG